jgi:hypothetical protein
MGTPRTARTRRVIGSFTLSEAGRAFAAKRGMGDDVDTQFSRFRDHHLARGSLMADWEAAWRTWVCNAEKFRAHSHNFERAGPEPATARYGVPGRYFRAEAVYRAAYQVKHGRR